MGGYAHNMQIWNAEDRVRAMRPPPRRTLSIRALKLTGTCLHPARIG